MDLVRQGVDLFVTGGPVMWPLLGMSLIGLALGFERGLFWMRAHRSKTSEALARARERFSAGDRAGAAEWASRAGTIYTPVILRLAESGPPAGGEVMERTRREAERFGNTLSLVITGAPLLGILGTVLGIIQSFQSLGASGIGDVELQSIAAGIAQALVSTAFGLIVALLALVPYSLMRGQAQRAIGEAEALVTSAGGQLAE